MKLQGDLVLGFVEDLCRILTDGHAKFFPSSLFIYFIDRIVILQSKLFLLSFIIRAHIYL